MFSGCKNSFSVSNVFVSGLTRRDGAMGWSLTLLPTLHECQHCCKRACGAMQLGAVGKQSEESRIRLKWQAAYFGVLPGACVNAHRCCMNMFSDSENQCLCAFRLHCILGFHGRKREVNSWNEIQTRARGRESRLDRAVNLIIWRLNFV